MVGALRGSLAKSTIVLYYCISEYDWRVANLSLCYVTAFQSIRDWPVASLSLCCVTVFQSIRDWPVANLSLCYCVSEYQRLASCKPLLVLLCFRVSETGQLQTSPCVTVFQSIRDWPVANLSLCCVTVFQSIRDWPAASLSLPASTSSLPLSPPRLPPLSRYAREFCLCVCLFLCLTLAFALCTTVLCRG